MKQLRDRVIRLREEYVEIYTIGRTEGRPSINWGSIIDEKLVWKSEAFLAPVRLYRFLVKQSSLVLFGSQTVLGNILRRSNIVVIPKC